MIVILGSMLTITGFFSFRYKNAEDEKNACDLVSKTIYLAVDEYYNISDNEYTIEDENIAYINDGKIIGLNKGTTIISNNCEEYIVNVSDLYSIAVLNNNKPFLKDNIYSKEDNEYLDDVLSYLINEKGYKTRAGVVEAARFLTLRFKYKMNYFYETGRLVANYVVDGEGRFYHKGLYLNEYKYDQISISDSGPAYWGKEILDLNGDLSPNSLDCSGFVCWAMYNGGFDIGDIGAGPSEDVFDLTDVGELVLVEDLDMDKIKPGDLCGFDGHVAMFIGKDNSHLYVAESYWEGDMHILAFTYDEFKNSDFEYVMLMDDYYKEDGNLSYLW